MQNQVECRTRFVMTTGEVAQALGVSPNQLRSWCEQYEYPASRHVDGRRVFDRRQIGTLRAALAFHLSIPAAIDAARAAEAARAADGGDRGRVRDRAHRRWRKGRPRVADPQPGVGRPTEV